MPLSNDNFRDLCASRDIWIARFESHLRQSITAANNRRNHFGSHGGYHGALDETEIETYVKGIIQTFKRGRVRAPDRYSTTQPTPPAITTSDKSTPASASAATRKSITFEEPTPQKEEP